jgi:hypothetical protein
MFNLGGAIHTVYDVLCMPRIINSTERTMQKM